MEVVAVTEDKKVVQCNYAEGTNIAAQGARAYVVRPNPGNGHDRILILVRSRGARWVEKWENTARLTNFRVKTLPSEHPLYVEERLFPAEYLTDLLAAVGARVNCPDATAEDGL
jgi:hypothetical protein